MFAFHSCEMLIFFYYVLWFAVCISSFHSSTVRKLFKRRKWNVQFRLVRSSFLSQTMILFITWIWYWIEITTESRTNRSDEWKNNRYIIFYFDFIYMDKINYTDSTNHSLGFETSRTSHCMVDYEAKNIENAGNVRHI